MVIGAVWGTDTIPCMARKILLSIDGGGIRGILPLCALIELESQLRKPAREVFSFMSGTSTGAIIAAGLAQGIPAEKALDLYRTLGREVFKFDLLNFIASLGSFKYRSAPLHAKLVEFVGDPALNELPIDIMLTALRVRDGRPFYFVKDNPSNAQTTGKLRLADCVTASSAAPTFFDPWNVPGIGDCVDGGVTIAGNPCYQTCVEAFDYSPPGAYTPANSTVIALGTGHYDATETPNNLLAWVRFVIGQLLEEPSDQQTELVRRHYVPQGLNLFRWNPALPREIGMDDVNQIETLIAIGKAAATELDWQKILEGSMARALPESRPRRNAID
jgi:uncharacterized protein